MRTIRGKAAIVGIGEVPTRRSYEDRTTLGLCAEAVRLALDDAGLSKAEVNGLVTDGGTTPAAMAEYINLRPTFATGVAMQGASGASATSVAAAAIHAGLCDTAVVVMGNSRLDRARAGAPPNTVRAEWEIPHGMAAGANTGYGLIYVRHMHEYGTKPQQMAKMAVDQRVNALKNPNAVFQGQPLTVDDESREILGEINKIK